jgi:hypothetical protein
MLSIYCGEYLTSEATTKVGEAVLFISVPFATLQICFYTSHFFTMASSNCLYLTAPIQPSAVQLGQLLPDPLFPIGGAYSSASVTSADEEVDFVETNYKHDVSSNFDGHLISVAPRATPELTLEAEASTFRHLRSAAQSQTFKQVIESPDAQKWIMKKAALQKPFFFVTGIQELQNAKATRHDQTTSRPGGLSHSRRDSAMDTTATSSSGIYGIEVREVRCKVGRAEEPHSISDVGYVWSYYAVADDLQLAVGLGNIYGSSSQKSSDLDSISEASDNDEEGWWS